MIYLKRLITPKSMINIQDSLLSAFLPAHYIDTYQRDIYDAETLTAEKLFYTMFTDFPWWIGGLMKLRNTIVKPLGLKIGGFEERLSEMVQCHNDRELVWGMNDKHLCFYVLMWCNEKSEDKQTIGITTIVKYNNRLGRAYFFVIKPFHRLIVKSLLNRIK